MNYRFWGGWFLVITLVIASLMIGCGTQLATLGVKKASVSGRLVDADTLRPIAGGLIRMMGNEAADTGASLEQINTFMSTTSDENGYFFFDNVTPDNVVFMMSAPGYLETAFPTEISSQSTSSGGSGEGSDSDSSSSSKGETDIEYISILSGAHVDLKEVKMTSNGKAPQTQIILTIDLVDHKANRRIEDDTLSFFVRVGKQSFTGLTPSQLAAGIEVDSAASAIVEIQNINGIYKPFKSEPAVNISSDTCYRAEMEPYGFELVVATTNVPDYLGKYPMDVFIETLGDVNLPSITVASGSVPFPTDIKGGAKFFTIPVTNIKDGVVIRARLRGYEDIVARIEPNTLSNMDNMTRRIDFNFLMTGGKSHGSFSSSDTNWELGVYDFILKRPIKVIMKIDRRNKVDKTKNLKLSLSLPTFPSTFLEDQSEPEIVGGGDFDYEANRQVLVAAGYECSITGSMGGHVATGSWVIDLPTEPLEYGQSDDRRRTLDLILPTVPQPPKEEKEEPKP